MKAFIISILLVGMLAEECKEPILVWELPSFTYQWEVDATYMAIQLYHYENYIYKLCMAGVDTSL